MPLSSGTCGPPPISASGGERNWQGPGGREWNTERRVGGRKRGRKGRERERGRDGERQGKREKGKR